MTNWKLWVLAIILFSIGMWPVSLAVFIVQICLTVSEFITKKSSMETELNDLKKRQMELEIENLKKKVADLENSSRN